MRVVQVVSSIDDRSAGPSYSVTRLAEAISGDPSVESSLFSLGEPGNICANGIEITKYEADYQWAGALKRLGCSKAMMRGLREANHDIVHSHGLWMMPNVYPMTSTRKSDGKFVLSPRGMLGEQALKFSRLKKRLFWSAYQKKALHSVACLHATAGSELDDIRKFGLKNPVAIIPNGVDLPDLGGVQESVDSSPYVLSLGRIHPKKGLNNLIRAWAQIFPEFPRWRLRIVGPDEVGYVSQLKELSIQLGVHDTVSIEPPVFAEEKNRLMRNAHVFALPTLHENFAMTVAESLSLETPVISTKGAPWSGLIDEKCGWWIDHGVDPLVSALRDAMAMPRETLNEMGARGRDWMGRDFGWHAIGAKMLVTYAWIKGRADKPNWVTL